MSVLTIIAILALVVIAGYYVGSWLFRKDTEIEERRRAAAKLAGVLASYGLSKVPEFLIDYSVGDYSGMGNKIKQITQLFLSGETAVVTEFERVFEACLNVKLNSEAGRAYIGAKLGEAMEKTEVSPS